MTVPNTTSFLGAELPGFHRLWITEARRFLAPALESGADFWTRWAAVRYLSDDFRERHAMELVLMHRLRPVLAEDVAARLVTGGDGVFHLRLEADRIGRRRGTAKEFAEGVAALLERLETWLAEIERAAAELTPGSSMPAPPTPLHAGKP